MLWLIAIWPLLSLLIFIILNKKWNKRNHVALNIFYSLTLLVFFPLEALYWTLIRNKYNKTTKQVLTLLNEKKFKYHVVFGTFLFAYRDKNFRDTDVDICVYRKDFNKQQEKIIRECGFILKEQWSLDGKISEQTYKHELLNISMDIFHISTGPEFAPTFDEKNSRYARRPKTFKYTLKKYSIDGIEFFGPAEASEYLSWNYGIWKTKDSNYHWLYGSSTHPTVIVDTDKIIYKKYD